MGALRTAQGERPRFVLALPLGLLQVVIQEADLAPLDVDFAFLIWARMSDIPHL